MFAAMGRCVEFMPSKPDGGTVEDVCPLQKRQRMEGQIRQWT